MAIFQANILKDEEIIGGFTPNSASDESFLLNNMDNYPGELPDFSIPSVEIIEEPLIEPEEVTETLSEEIQPDSDSVWNVFNDDTAAEPVVFETNEEPAAAEDSVDYSSMFSQDQDTSSDTDEDFEEMLRRSMAEETNAARFSEQIDLSQSETQAVTEQIFEPVAENKDTVIKNQHTVDDFVSVDGLDGAKEFNLSDAIPAQHPSTIGLQTSEAGNNNTGKEEKAKEKPPKEKKDKKPISPLVKRFALIAAIVLISVGLAGGLYYFGIFDSAVHYVSGLFQKDTTVTAAQPKEIAANEHHKKDTVNPKEVHQEPAKEVEVKHEEVLHNDKPAENVSIPEHKEKVSNIENKDLELVKKLQEENARMKSEIERLTTKPAQPKRTAPAGKVPKHTEPKTKSDVTNVPKPKADKASITKSKAEVIEKPKSDVIEKPKEKVSADELYTIQLYSSPSKLDAEEWAMKIKKKFSGDVHISPQQVRDRVWYRVRCGYFKNKEEAKSAASDLGFSQYWIDRVK